MKPNADNTIITFKGVKFKHISEFDENPETVQHRLVRYKKSNKSKDQSMIKDLKTSKKAIKLKGGWYLEV